MARIDCCLVADGPSDIALVPILEWLVRQYAPSFAVECEWVDLRRLREPPTTLSGKIRAAVGLSNCQLLFVHRDAESRPPDERYLEIRSAIEENQYGGHQVSVPYVCVVPVRMQEAWMLLDECAIRQAAGNPNGRVRLDLPSPSTIETLADPKEILHSLLRTASEKRGRRLKKLRVSQCARLVSRHMRTFDPLRVLAAFQRLEAEVERTVHEWGN